MFPITLRVQFLYHYGYRFSNCNGLLSYLPSDLQRSSTYSYKHIALLSFGVAFVFLRYFCMLHWIACFLAQHTLQDLHRILTKL